MLRQSTAKIQDSLLLAPKISENKVEIKSLYSVLELEDYSSIQDVKKAYKKLALIHHPDKGGDQEQFKKIGHAYYVLSDQDRKEKYDHMLKFGLSDDLEDFMDESYDIFSKGFTGAIINFMEQEFALRKYEKSNISPSPYGVPAWMSFYKTAGKVGQVYWVVGSPIKISESPGVLRRDISNSEIINSFKNIDNILLIKDEGSAFEYSWATRIGDLYSDEFCAQSAYAKVKLMQPVYSKPKRLQSWVNEEYVDEDGFTTSMKSDAAILCMDAKKQDVKFQCAKLLVVPLNSAPKLEILNIQFTPDNEDKNFDLMPPF